MKPALHRLLASIIALFIVTLCLLSEDVEQAARRGEGGEGGELRIRRSQRSEQEDGSPAELGRLEAEVRRRLRRHLQASNLEESGGKQQEEAGAAGKKRTPKDPPAKHQPGKGGCGCHRPKVEVKKEDQKKVDGQSEQGCQPGRPGPECKKGREGNLQGREKSGQKKNPNHQKAKTQGKVDSHVRHLVRQEDRPRKQLKVEPLPKIAKLNPTYQSIKSHMKVLATRVFPKKVRPNRCKNCNNFNFRPIIRPTDICSGKNPIDLLVMVTSIPQEADARQAVRDTWLKHSKENTGNIRHVFLFGGGWSEKEQAILYYESAKYGDILQEDYLDAYYNLSLKVMSGYKWGLKFCSQAKFTLRTADDNYINVPELVKWIRTDGPKNMRAQIGHNTTNLNVLRRKIRKWYITPLEFPEKYYPYYAVGTAFLFSMKAVAEIVKIAPHIPYFCIEDAWFGMVMRELKIPVVDEQRFDKQLEDELLKQMIKGECPDGGKFLSLHLVSPEAMEKLWKQCP